MPKALRIALGMVVIAVGSGFANEAPNPGLEPAAVVQAVLELARQGDARAQLLVGSWHDVGEQVPEDDAEAVRWYRRAAEQGLADAQLNLGVMYDNGEGVPEDDAEAARWYRLAAEQGYPRAQLNIALQYITGQGVPVDHVRAYAWLELGAAGGDPDAGNVRDSLAKTMTPQQIARAQALKDELVVGVPQQQ